jgi:uncharacterized membrane protein YeaQ/YmgE (transglycosylase-associated protein family)
MFGLDMIIIWLAIGFLAGLAANTIMKRQSVSAWTDVLLGVMGAGVGSLILSLLGFYTRGGLLNAIVTATFGAVLLIWFNRRFMSRNV